MCTVFYFYFLAYPSCYHFKLYYIIIMLIINIVLFIKSKKREASRMDLAEEPASKKGKYVENFNLDVKFPDSKLAELPRLNY